MSYHQSNVVTGHHGVALDADVYPSADRDKRSVIMLHGGGQNRHAWTKTARTIHAAGHIVAYGAPGHSSWNAAGRYGIEDFAYDRLAVRERYGGRRPAVALGPSTCRMTILTAHRSAPPRLWGGIVLVDVTSRMELDGARRAVLFMSAHPDGFAILRDAGDVIAAHNPHRPRPGNVDGLTKVLRQRDDGCWVWRWDPALVTSGLDVMRAVPANTEQACDRWPTSSSTAPAASTPRHPSSGVRCPTWSAPTPSTTSSPPSTTPKPSMCPTPDTWSPAATTTRSPPKFSRSSTA
jgi:pimeloyl-ACP methyl ester carboxylesterase